MVRTGTEGFQVSFPTFVELFIFVGYESVDLPLQTVGSVCRKKIKNSACISVQFRMVLGLRELSQIMALSFKVRGKNVSLIKSTLVASSLKVLQTSSKSRICEYGFLLSIPWKVGSRGKM